MRAENQGDPVMTRHRFGLLLPNATVFVASLCIMVGELVAGRMVAGHLGGSLYTWTSCIGVFLAGLALGNYLGGRIADRGEAGTSLFFLFVFASLACLLVPVMNSWMGGWPWLWDRNWPTRIVLHVTATFILPATMLGTIGPVVAKMALDEGYSTGRTLGQVYAWSAVGSIVGTYLTGFYLIARFGTTETIVGASAVLAAMGLLYGRRRWLARSWAMVCISACLLAGWRGGVLESAAISLRLRDTPHPDVVWEDESSYSHIWVSRVDGDPNLRALTLDRLTHSVVDLRNPTLMKYDYCQVYEAVVDKYSAPGRPVAALLLGGGGYAFPRYLEITRAHSQIDVAEIDPAVTRAARQACGLPEDSRIRILHQDARAVVTDRWRQQKAGRAAPLYDYIFGDTFNDTSVPFHLTTLEFQRQLSDLLAPDGLYLLNCIDVLESGRFLASMIQTCRAVFPCVYVLACGEKAGDRSTFVLVCAKAPRDLADIPRRVQAKYSFAGNLWDEAKCDQLIQTAGGMVLTDDFVPVENLLAAVSRQRGRYAVDEYLEAGAQAARAGRIGRAEDLFRRAVTVNPQHARARYNLGLLLAQTGRTEEALPWLKQACRLDAQFTPARDLLSLILFQSGRLEEDIQLWTDLLVSGVDVYAAHVNLGELYNNQGRLGPALEHWEQAAGMDPHNAALHFKMGVACAAAGKIREAADHYSAALHEDPGFTEAHQQLGALMSRPAHEGLAEKYSSEAATGWPDLEPEPRNQGAENKSPDLGPPAAP